MFTGIVEETGRVVRFTRSKAGARIEVEAAKVLDGTRIGDSIAVNGVCLTVAKIGARSFCADVMNETLQRSSFRSCAAGDAVNLERALTLASRMGGHIVTGHIDGTAEIERVARDGQAVWFTISAPEGLSRYIVWKGSVAIDGMSLTVAHVDGASFGVSCIPHTMESTVLQQRRAGDAVNIECDLLAKYTEKLLGACGADGALEAGGADGSLDAAADQGGDSKRDAAGEEGRPFDLGFLAENGFI